MTVEKAKISDVKRIHQLVNGFAERGEMLAQALSEIYENPREFFVIRDNSAQVIARVALHTLWEDLAEIKSLAVSEDKQDQGLGSVLLRACLNEAVELGIRTVFCMTYSPVFFEKHGFRQVGKMELPRKVWSECYRCPKFPDCDKVTLVYHSGSGRS